MKSASSWMEGYGWCWAVTQILRWAVIVGVAFVLALVIAGAP
jgi:hypothetical protein